MATVSLSPLRCKCGTPCGTHGPGTKTKKSNKKITPAAPDAVQLLCVSCIWGKALRLQPLFPSFAVVYVYVCAYVHACIWAHELSMKTTRAPGGPVCQWPKHWACYRCD